MILDTPRLIDLPKIPDDRGNLSFFENGRHIPFDIKRMYWIYDVPGGERRGGHAYQQLSEVIIALSGAFDVILHDGAQEQRFHLNRSYMGLYVPPMVWRQMDSFSTNSMALIAADAPYDESDYVRDFEQFKQMKYAG